MPSLYAPDLAYVHHVGHRAVPEAAARWLVRELAARDVPEGPILDLGCGSGVFAAAVAASGRPVRGVDVSPAMLALARKTAPRARFTRGSLHALALPRAAVVTAIGEGLCYLPASGRLPSLDVTFGRVQRCLVSGGLFVFDLLTGPLATLAPRSGFRTGPDWAVLSETRPLRAPSRLERRITTFRAVGSRYRRSDEVHRVHVHDPRRVRDALRRAGFTVRTLPAYDAASRLPGRTVFVARRR